MEKNIAIVNVDHPILLFDGVCNLCNGTVQWILERDAAARFRFASLQSTVGQQLLAQHGLTDPNLDSIVMIAGERIYTHSDVPLEIAKQLGGFWQMGYVFKIVPRFVRDAVYRFIAKNRYRWFGKQEESCWLPQPKWKARFL
ncbi:MAG: thiol-disulfide oxidoreductase DCC family protein [Bacteroidota bacterium]